MQLDRNVPHALKMSQQWFAGVITQSIDAHSQISSLAPSGNPIESEAPHFIAPSPTLLPHQRMQIYNQQYWWRLLSSLHDNFPLVTRLFGYYDFNHTIAIPFLLQHPPKHWSLGVLGADLPQWIRLNYTGEDRGLVADAAAVDWEYDRLFTVGSYPPLRAALFAQNGFQANLEESDRDQADNSQATESAALQQKIYLQPYVELFDLDYDIFDFRWKFLQSPVEHWIENDFPELVSQKRHYFALYRTLKNNIGWKELSWAEHRLLKAFQTGASVEDACAAMEEGADPEIFQAAVPHIAVWFQEWVVRNWLAASPTMV